MRTSGAYLEVLVQIPGRRKQQLDEWSYRSPRPHWHRGHGHAKGPFFGWLRNLALHPNGRRTKGLVVRRSERPKRWIDWGWILFLVLLVMVGLASLWTGLQLMNPTP